MAGSVNKVILIGNLGRDPETRSFSNGGKVCNLRIATSESWKDKQTGEGLANVAERYLRKGSKVYIEGQLRTRKWQDQSGNDRYSTEVVIDGFNGSMTMLDGRDGGGAGGGAAAGGSGDSWGGSGGNDGGYGGGQSSGTKPAGGAFDDDLDDDVPF